MDMDTKRKEIIKEFNEKYGRELLNIEKCKAIREEYLQKKNDLLQKLTLDETTSIGRAITKAEDISKQIECKLEESRELAADISKHLNETNEACRSIQERLDKMRKLDCTVQYLRVLQHVENLSVQLHKQWANKNDEQCATLFANMTEVLRILHELHSLNLFKQIKEVVVYWYDHLKDKYSKDLEEVLKILKWPFVNANVSLQTPPENQVRKLKIISEYLLQIELPVEVAPNTPNALGFHQLCLPVQVLVTPLRKRFRYHFYGPRQTNRLDKPEWYFTQILVWIRDHKDSVKSWIQPVIHKFGLHHIEAEVEFMQGLIELAVEKLQSDLPTLQYDDYTFSHSIDEALGFNKELTESYNYPKSEPGILVVLTQAQVFMKWLAMEKKYALEKMDLMLQSSVTDTFQPILSENDDLKITLCADMFVTLLQTITERYEPLPQPGHRLQFLELQLELLDDFRIRLVQIAKMETNDVIDSKIPMIANTLYYIENVLLDWGATLHYLNLYYYKTTVNNFEKKDIDVDMDGELTSLEKETVFVDTLKLYRHMRRGLLSTLAEAVVSEIKTTSKNYRLERWSMMQNTKEFQSLCLTPSACAMFEKLTLRLLQLQKKLTEQLFAIVWKSIARQIDTYLFENLVLENRFNDCGALQFKYDVTRNLLPVFHQYTDRPSTYFPHLNETCILLTLIKGSALLLRETLVALEGATGVEDIRGRALREMGVTYLTPNMALNILNRRTDINLNMFVID